MRDNSRMSKRIAVVGGGISGLATAFWLRKIRPDWDVRVLEREAVPGGKIRTTARKGYTVEWGPNGFLTNVEHTLGLASELGLDDALLTASPAAAKRYLFHQGALRPLPSRPPDVIGTELVSVIGKARAALEPVLARRDWGAEETVHAFLARHFGAELAEVAAEPLVLGITAGDPKQLSLDALFPRIRTLEEEHRSLVLGLIAAQKTAQKTARKTARKTVCNTKPESAPKSTRTGRLTSFHGGMFELVEALVVALGDTVQADTSVRALEPGGSGEFNLALDRASTTGKGERREETLVADGVVLAVPAFAASELLGGWSPTAATLLAGIPFAPIRVFGLGYDRVDVPRTLDGFGFLAPGGAGVRSLGVLWSSAIFPDRAPSGKVLLRVLAGGTRDSGFMDLSAGEALDAVRRDLRITMGITAEPEHVEQVEWPNAIPQYLIGHRERVSAIEAAIGTDLGRVAGRVGALVLSGNSYRGISVNDCVRHARSTAEAIVSRLSP